MGCSASRLDTLIAKAIEDPLSTTMVPKTRSLSSALVHHPATKKGDTHHLVCLTSTTYGSLLNVDNISNNNSNNSNNNECSLVEDDDCLDKASPDSVINAWELMEGLEDEEIEVKVHKFDYGNDFMPKNLSLCDFNDAHELPVSKFGLNLVDSGSDFDDSHKFPASKSGKNFVDSDGEFKAQSSNLCDFNGEEKVPSSKFGMGLVGCGEDYMVKRSDGCSFEDAQKSPSSKLGLNLVDCSSDFKFMSSNSCYFKDEQKTPPYSLGFHLSDSSMKLNDSYVFVEIPSEIVEENMGFALSPSTKPLWEHLSEESLLAKMDPYVSNAYESALSPEKLRYDVESRNGSSTTGSSPWNFKSSYMYSNSPMRSKFLPSDDKIVLYFTTLRGIRKTYEDCSTVRAILGGFRVVVDERDISMDSSYRQELQSKLVGKAMSLPQLFIRGKHIGGADDVKLLHETGELESILEGCPTKDNESVCESCGDARFVPCSNCYGSRKVYHEEEGRTRKCPKCNENGLLRCPACCS
ncbi:uncharacterized protein LOC141641990 [Silene latifolia]|uniref:uncharacterized protein LOC141641990 n=1 Tax=Silene latifolia TaxID=37657 RepID=UPI003D76B3CC